ncbi:bifunctional DNA-binding transcriptional regulator/O6-methylguanine-DNA methyltransferase Ada [Hahella aquimaris]|uniref:bifunctional DNA-binding transcriptional regulator/O6-methylguanine-DNA methyltransferase Ada n=1 Tax=Hahella sp. HNIBRBA332 TaxID=3015983 RepID=UPI00273BD51D|nr:bifunctional DNA-binding transcriptional regulator/O6-methylguanine-DNA methyltransferase Ada [Hahella sp. HNIBRBA332]WLQ11970.1 bifunctional DNA-binding transcriptional regulator/O6-methylguanine-DNA methyltransferase Ada [Hahella sp. HNIBRBA332]
MNASTKVIATENDPRWRALLERDAQADGSFYYSVKTTGVYCRPSCAARRPRPENVRFYDSREEAEQAGFRPCRRCRPDAPSLATQHAEKIAAACRLIADSETFPSLEQLAQSAGMSKYHFHRLFKQVTGLTPRGYAAAQRKQRLDNALQKADTVTDAIYDAGYSSNGHFYGESDQLLGMTPSEYRQGGSNAAIRFAVGECALGSILVAQSARGVCAIFLGDDPEALVHELQDRFPKAQLIGDDADFERVIAKVVGFVEAPQIGLDLPLDIRGAAFQQRVWRALQEIPSGATASYADIAQRIGSPKSARAVARACAANLLAVAIPCHRVVRSDGALSGYRWGVERKQALLEREAQE